MRHPEITPNTKFVSETLHTDTVVYEILRRTEQTMTVRTTSDLSTMKVEHRSGNPMPCTWTGVASDENGKVKIVRKRRDGTFRMGNGYGALRPATLISGVPCRFTDYRY